MSIIVTYIHEISPLYPVNLLVMLCRCDVLSLLSHFLLVTNSSVNIVIYCWKDEKFRQVFLQGPVVSNLLET